jgi:hypothetical protein
MIAVSRKCLLSGLVAEAPRLARALWRALAVLLPQGLIKGTFGGAATASAPTAGTPVTQHAPKK